MMCLRDFYSLIFINDSPLNFDFCLSEFYADGGTVYTHDKNIETVEIKLQGDLNNAKNGVKKAHFHSIITKPHV